MDSHPHSAQQKHQCLSSVLFYLFNGHDNPIRYVYGLREKEKFMLSEMLMTHVS